MSKTKNQSASLEESVSVSYTDFLQEFDSDMENIRERYGLGENSATDCVFNYLIADRYSDLTPELDGFEYSDGKNDLGIDFWIENEGFVICQCKSCDYLGPYSSHPKTYDASVVNEIREGLSFLLKGERSANVSVEKLRKRYCSAQESLDDEEAVPVEAIIAVLGEFTAAAMEEYSKLVMEMKEENVTLSVIDWHKVSELIRGDVTEGIDIKKIELRLNVKDKDKDILRQDNWFSAVVQLGGFIDGYKEYGNSLFDMNVRAQFERSRINKNIAKGLKSDKGRKRFTHLNNGILLFVDSYGLRGADTTVSVKGAQIINGCQTVTSIYDAYNDMAGNSEEQKKIRETKVLVKVLNRSAIDGPEMLNSIIVATNDQNPMTARNLKSNTIEQKELKRSFNADFLPEGMRYFYIRKENELYAAITDDARFEKKRYLIKGTTARKQNKYRNIDNKDLAQTWLAWLGDAQDANQQSGEKMFGSESSKLYELVFKKRPDDQYWDAYKQPNFVFEKGGEGFVDGAPTVFQFFVAMACHRYIEAKFEQENETKSKALKRLRLLNRLTDQASEADQYKALQDDREYYLKFWRRNMQFTYVSLMSFVLCGVEGDLSPATCRKICNCEDVEVWIEHGMAQKTAPNEFFNNMGLLARVYGFVDFVVEMYLNTNYGRFLIETKIKALLGKHDTVCKLKKLILEQNECLRDYPKPFKPEEGMTVFESFEKYVS